MPLPMPTRFSGDDVPTPVIGGRPLPAFLLRDLSPPLVMPDDDLGKRIATLMALHPSVAAKHGGVDIASLDYPSKVSLLAAINADLGIRSLSRRTFEAVRD